MSDAAAASPRRPPDGRTLRRPILRGRETELDVIGEALAAAAAGEGGVLLVDGAPGIGKTSLLLEAQAIARRVGVRTIVGQAFESRASVPFAPLLDATLEATPPIAPPDLRRVLTTESDLRYWMLHELQEALEATALAAPLAIVLDDLHWADPGTLAALGTLPSNLSTTPLLWILAKRKLEGRPPVRETLARLERAGARRLTVGPLSDAAVAAVVADMLDAPAGDDVLVLAGNALGNPFLLVELLEGLREEGRLRVEEGLVHLDGRALPRRVTESMRERLDRLPEDVRQIIRAASVLGPRFSVRQLAQMLQRRPSALLQGLDEVMSADLIVATGDELQFRHDLLRQAVLESLPGSLRRALQREAANVLLDAGAPPGEIASRLAASAEVGDREAIAKLREVAGLLAASDAAAAADLSVRALELLPERDDARGPLVAETVLLLHAALRPDEAQTLGDRALGGVLPPDQEAEVRLSLSKLTMREPRTRAQENQRALELPGLSPAMRRRHLGWLAFNLATVDADGAGAAARAAAAEAGGDPEGQVMAALGLICVDSTSGRSVRALERLEALRREMRGAPPAPHHLLVDFFHACVLADLGRMDEALAFVSGGVARARRERNSWLLETWSQTGAALLLAAGRVGDAQAAAESLDTVVDHIARGSFAGATALVTLARVAVHTADAHLLRATEQAARDALDTRSADVRRHAAWVLALGAMARGDAAEAARRLADPARPYCTPTLPNDAGHEPAVARIALAAGDHELARRALEVARRRARENPGAVVIAAAARQTHGLIEGDVSALMDAARMLDGTQRPLLHAAAAEDAGRALSRAGRTTEAVAALESAHDRYAACKATGDAQRVRGLLRGHGVRTRGTSKDRPVTGWASLTDSELRVVRVVAQGATNRDAAEQLFLSPHTVSSHLRHAFAKLDINSRNELTRIVLAQEGVR